MRKKQFIYSGVFLCFMFFSLIPLFSQDEPSLVPRKVFFGSQQGNDAADDANDNEEGTGGMLRSVRQLLADDMVSGNDIVRVYDREEANSQVLVGITEETTGYMLEAVLSEKGEVKTDHSRRIEAPTDYEGITAFIDGAVEKMSPFMTKVEQKIDIEYLVQGEQVRQSIDTIDFRETLNKRFSVTADVGGFMQIMKIGSETPDGNVFPTVYSPYLPVSLQWAWYPSRNSGLVVSFFYDNNSIMSFGHNANITEEAVFGESVNNIFLPGIGFSQRSLGRLSAGFNLVLSPGFVTIEAVDPLFNLWAEDIRNTEGIRLAAGETETLFYPVLTFDAKIAFHLTSWLALKTGLSMNLCVTPLFKMSGPNEYYVVSGNTLFFRLAPVGITVSF